MKSKRENTKTFLLIWSEYGRGRKKEDEKERKIRDAQQ